MTIPTYNNLPYTSYDPSQLTPDTLSDETTNAMSGLNYAQPFFASYLYDRVKIISLWPHDPRSQEIPTAATDGRRMFANVEFFASIASKQAMGVIAHEVNHDMLGHPAKMRVWNDWKKVLLNDGTELPYVHQLMNIAMDAEINPVLKQSKLELPPGCVFIDWVKPGEMTIEDIYARLFKETPPEKIEQMLKEQEGGGQGKGEGQSESGMQGEHGNFDRHIVPHDKPSEADEADRKRALKAAVAAGQRAGNVPENLKRMVEDLTKPLVDWRDAMRDMIVTRIGLENLDWKRMHKRRFLIAGCVEPARKSERCGNIVFLFDVSGSVTPYVTQFLSEVASVAEELSPRQIIVLWTDTRVAHVDTLEEAYGADIAKLTVHGGGGTDLTAGFRWIDENLVAFGEEIAAVVVLTDSYTPWPQEDGGYPVICATTGPQLDHPSWFEIVELDEVKATRRH